MGVDIEILGGVGVIGLQLNFTAIPTFTFYLEEIFCIHLFPFFFFVN